MDQPDAPLRPHRARRAAGFVLDLMAATAIALLTAGIVGLFVPADQPRTFLIGLAVALVPSFGYLVVLPAFVPSLGRALFSLHVVGSDGQPLLGGRRILRELVTTLLWPINGLMVLFGAAGHVGDAALSSRVGLAPQPRNVWLALGLGVVASIALFYAGMLGARVGMMRSPAWIAARAAVPGAHARLPKAFTVLNDDAVFWIEGSDGYHAVQLARRDGAWTIVGSQQVERGQVPSSASVTFFPSNQDELRGQVEEFLRTTLTDKAKLTVNGTHCPSGSLQGTFQCSVETAERGTIKPTLTLKEGHLTLDRPD